MSTAESGPTRAGGVGTRNVRTAESHRLLESLPTSVRRNAEAAFQMFLASPDHPALRRHPLQDIHRGRHRAESWSVSVNIQYRAIYVVDGDTNVWYWIGSHADYDRLTGRKS
jgi:plasmid maintenance system killer protein